MRLSHALSIASCLLAAPAVADQTFGTLVLVEAGPVPSGPSPLSAESPEEWRFVELVYAPLYASAGADAMEPVLARSARVEEGGKRLVVELRENAQWSMGKDITAADVVYTYQLARAGKWNRAWVDHLAPLADVHATEDGYDIVFELKAAVPAPERLLDVPLVPSGLHGPLDDPDQQRPLPLGVIGAGPFTEAQSGDHSRLVANARAIRKARISEIQIVSVGSPALAMEYVRLVSEAVTFSLAPDDVSLLAAEVGARRLTLPGWRIDALAFRPGDTQLSDAAVRTAFLRSFDRAELYAPGEPAVASAAPVEPSSPLFPKGLATLPRDTIEAQAELWRAGWTKDLEQDYFIRTSATQGTETVVLPLLCDADDASGMRRIDVLRARLREAGIRLDADPRPRFEFLSRIRSRKFPAALVSLEVRDGVGLSPLFHSRGGANITSFESAEVDRRLEAGDDAGAVAALTKADAIVFLGIQHGVGAAGRSVTAPVVQGFGGMARADRWQVR